MRQQTGAERVGQRHTAQRKHGQDIESRKQSSIVLNDVRPPRHSLARRGAATIATEVNVDLTKPKNEKKSIK
jgi:hypothetical protein